MPAMAGELLGVVEGLLEQPHPVAVLLRALQLSKARRCVLVSSVLGPGLLQAAVQVSKEGVEL